MMRRRFALLLVVFSLVIAPAGMACVQAEAVAGASPAASCCCGPMAEACASARIANVPHGCPCASRDEAPAMPSVPPAPAGERPASTSAAGFDHALVSVELASIAEGAQPSGQFGAQDKVHSRGFETSLCILDCVFRL